MRRHRVLRNTSTQSLCVFCAFRLSGQVVPATTPQRRLISNTQRPSQQATAQAPQQEASQQTQQWSFDPNSSLSPSEQRERAHRQQIRREREEREEAERQKARHEEEKRQHERQIRQFQEREAAQKARRQQDDARRREARQRAQAGRHQQASQPFPRPRHERQRAQRPGANAGNEGGNAEAISQSPSIQGQTPQVQRAHPRSGDARQQTLAGGRQGQQSVSQSLFGGKQVPQVSYGQQPPGRQRDAGRAGQSMQMPSFGGNAQTQEAAAGWGRGRMDVKPLQYKTDEQIKADEIAEVERVKREKQERKGQAKRDAEARQEAARKEAEQRRQQEQDRKTADMRSRFGAPAEQRRPEPRGYPQSPSAPPPRTNDAFGEAEGQYRATPFKPNEYAPPGMPKSDETWENTWQHLAPRKQGTAPQAPPSRNPSVHSDAQQQSRPIADAQTIDRNFQEYRRQRDIQPQSPFVNPNIADVAPSESTSGPARKPMRCARCLQPGHHARDCTGAIKCNQCGQEGHSARTCPQRPAGARTGQRADDRSDAFVKQSARASHPTNTFRTTWAGESAGSIERREPARESSEQTVYRPTRSPTQATDPFKKAGAAQRSRWSQASRSEEDAPKASVEAVEEPEEDVEVDRRSSRRSRRGFADEEDEVEEAAAPKSFDRRKEGRTSRRRESDEDADDEAMAAREERAARKAARKAQEKAEQEKKKAARAAGQRAGGGTQVQLPEFVSVSNLAQHLGVGYEAFVQRLEKLGYDDVFPGKVLNRETSGMVAMEYDFDPIFEGAGSTGAKSEEEERDLKAAPEVEDTTFLPIRPPVVTIMGHVDHGKTTILDYLRRTSVAAGEAGGITQHIGAFSVPLSASGKTITFLDTPGHAAFMSMRQRGANVTDIVILVVAADDSVKPQTLESIRCAREAGVPMIVAVNKVDKPEADVQRVKNDLSRHGVEIEDFGGEVQVVEVSGKTGQGLDALEENVVTLSEILDHRSDTEGAVEGWVLEATTKRAGRVATVLVRRGTLRPGAILVAGNTWARVRSLRDERDQNLTEVGPGMPVEVDGWRDQPNAGDEVLQASGEQKATDVVAFRLEKGERLKMEEDMEAINETRRLEQERRKAAEKAAKAAAAAASAEGKEGDLAAAPAPTDPEQSDQATGQLSIPFIIKADVSGSAEAVSAYIPSLTSPLIFPTILASSVGAINESDIELASASEGHIVAFNLPKNEEMRGLAESKGVKVLENDVIYRVLEQVKEVLEEKLPEVKTQRVVGEAEVGVVFEIGVGGRRKMKIAGCKVRNGSVARNCRVRVVRGGEKVYDGIISSLKNVKKDVQEMRKGTECGMGFEGWEGFQEGDQIQTFEEISEKRKL